MKLERFEDAIKDLRTAVQIAPQFTRPAEHLERAQRLLAERSSTSADAPVDDAQLV